ncbi:hypothetical protein J6590_015395 [Homalodisca vitripennis]|nr:hypothetical protein J6590_015395 [Homalodisca vitripennis]
MNCLKKFSKCSMCCGRFFSSTSTKCSEKPLIINKLNNVMTIGINRPETCNALNYDTANRLSDAISQLEEDDSVLVGVIHGVAGNFCSGFDLKEINNEPNLSEKLTGLRLTDRFVSKPLVAAVSGYAVGVGMDLALWCDIRVMEDNAVMGYFQRRFGNKAIRIMSGLGPIDSCREAFKNLNILTTVALFILEVTVHTSQQNIPRRGDVHSHNTRAANNYSLPSHRLTLFEKQPTYTGAKFLNILPPEVKNHTADKQQFRRELTR